MGLLAQLVLVARNSDGDENGWIQLVVFLIMGVLWAVGGIIKARSGKDKQKKQQQQREIQPKRAGSVREALSRFAARIETTETANRQKPLIRPKPAPAEAKKKRVEAPVIKAVPVTAKPKKTTELAVLSESDVSLGSAEQLQAAIIHYEILGKCTAMRGPREQVWM